MQLLLKKPPTCYVTGIHRLAKPCTSTTDVHKVMSNLNSKLYASVAEWILYYNTGVKYAVYLHFIEFLHFKSGRNHIALMPGLTIKIFVKNFSTPSLTITPSVGGDSRDRNCSVTSPAKRVIVSDTDSQDTWRALLRSRTLYLSRIARGR